jgi:hypothetical protein
VASVPWFTRHTRGTIEAERDHRRGSHVRSFRLHDRWPGTAHPRLLAAAVVQAPSVAPVDLTRWVDDGGTYDPAGAARLRIGDRAMKRCNA